MEEVIEQQTTQVQAAPEADLLAEVRRVLSESREPLTLSKIRAALPAKVRPATPEALAESLQRQVSANVLYLYPKYRSQQDRYWDRPMPEHLANLLEDTVREQPLPWSEVRRKLPDYARTLAEPVLDEQVARGKLYRHPPLSSRSGPRFGTMPPDPKESLRGELTGVFDRLEKLGFTRTQVREAALEMLHEEEWDTAPQATSASTSSQRDDESATEPKAATTSTPSESQP
jgi:hypothetical protein